MNGHACNIWDKNQKSYEGNSVVTYSTLIIGLGRAGSRFVRALQHLNSTHHDIELTAVADCKEAKLEAFRQNGIAAFTSYRDALQAGKYDIIVNCLNEKDHYGLFKYVADHSISHRRIISEKPLTETLEQAEDVRQAYDEKAISINFVERYSPIINDVRHKILEDNLRISRANFYWGKYRVHDHRPTMGVLSEMSHPIDLITWLAQVKPGCPYQVQVGPVVSSDFSPHADSALDSVTAGISFESGLLVTGSSSFVWEGRDRRMELFLSDQSGEISQMIALRFDSPVWDIDHLVCYDVQSLGGVPVKMWERTIKQEEIPSQEFSVHKIVGFLKENLHELQEQEDRDSLVHLSQGIYVQRILEDLKQASEDACFHMPGFRNNKNELYLKSPSLDEHEAALPVFASGKSLSASRTWDNGL